MLLKKAMEREHFFHCFQPIFDVRNNHVLGYEALFRSEEYSNPELAFLEAKKKGKLFELDTQSIFKAIQSYDADGYSMNDGLLFLNIIPSTLENKDFMSFIQQVVDVKSFWNQQIVLEISESEELDFSPGLIKRINTLKNFGFMLAIDDFGKSFSHFKTVIELNPEFIKLDRYLTADLAASLKKQNIIDYCLDYANKFESEIILEGIETVADLETAKKLGLKYGQGFLLGKPEKLPNKIRQAVLN